MQAGTGRYSSRVLSACEKVEDGGVDITVTTVGGTSATSVLDRFTFVPPPPVVTSLAPTSGYRGTLVTIHGSDFTAATQACFGGTCITTVTVIDDTTLTVPVPFSPLAGSTADVTVTTPAATSATSPSDLFTLLEFGLKAGRSRRLSTRFDAEVQARNEKPARGLSDVDQPLW